LRIAAAPAPGRGRATKPGAAAMKAGWAGVKSGDRDAKGRHDAPPGWRPGRSRFAEGRCRWCCMLAKKGAADPWSGLGPGGDAPTVGAEGRHGRHRVRCTVRLRRMLPVREGGVIDLWVALVLVLVPLVGCSGRLQDDQARADFASLARQGRIAAPEHETKIVRGEGWGEGEEVRVYFCARRPATGNACVEDFIGPSYQRESGGWRLIAVASPGRSGDDGAMNRNGPIANPQATLARPARPPMDG
jgi:hypothetical protein